MCQSVHLFYEVTQTASVLRSDVEHLVAEVTMLQCILTQHDDLANSIGNIEEIPVLRTTGKVDGLVLQHLVNAAHDKCPRVIVLTKETEDAKMQVFDTRLRCHLKTMTADFQLRLAILGERLTRGRLGNGV